MTGCPFIFNLSESHCFEYVLCIQRVSFFFVLDVFLVILFVQNMSTNQVFKRFSWKKYPLNSFFFFIFTTADFSSLYQEVVFIGYKILTSPLSLLVSKICYSINF
jgi:hypothetical protein